MKRLTDLPMARVRGEDPQSRQRPFVFCLDRRRAAGGASLVRAVKGGAFTVAKSIITGYYLSGMAPMERGNDRIQVFGKAGRVATANIS